VKTVTGQDGNFRVTATDRSGKIHDYCAKKVIVSTGYYDLANRLNVPGEDLPIVFHYYKEPYPYYDSDVLVVGGKNSAAETALDLWRHGARVTLVHRDDKISPGVKYWVRPDLENRIKNKEITAYFNSTVKEIAENYVLLSTPQGPLELKNDFVMAMTGYQPPFDFMKSMGIQFHDDEFHTPAYNEQTMGTNISGLYLAGVVCGGLKTNKWFIVKGGKTRAIVKVLGRGAIFLTSSLFTLASWMFWALFNLLAFCAACFTVSLPCRMVASMLRRILPFSTSTQCLAAGTNQLRAAARSFTLVRAPLYQRRWRRSCSHP